MQSAVKLSYLSPSPPILRIQNLQKLIKTHTQSNVEKATHPHVRSSRASAVAALGLVVSHTVDQYLRTEATDAVKQVFEQRLSLDSQFR